MTSQPDPARRNPDAHRAVLNAAWALLDSGGWHAVTVDRIAATGGVGKQTIYRWWRGKADVVLEAFLDRARSQLPASQARDAADLLRESARNFVLLYAGTTLGNHLRELLGAAQHDPELAAALRDHWFTPRREPLRQAVRQAQEDQRIRADIDADVILDLLFGPLHYRLLTGHGPIDREYADTVAALTLAAVTSDCAGRR
jgi:AcrR family transcriptional regulator